MIAKKSLKLCDSSRYGGKSLGLFIYEIIEKCKLFIIMRFFSFKFLRKSVIIFLSFLDNIPFGIYHLRYSDLNENEDS